MKTHSPPFGELHIHFRGTAPLAFFEGQYDSLDKSSLQNRIPERHLKLFSKFNTLSSLLKGDPLPNFGEVFKYESFEHFLATYLFTAYLVHSREDLYSMGKQVLDLLLAQQYDFVELTVSVPEYLMVGISLEEVLDCLMTLQRESSLKLLWVLDPVRNLGAERACSLLEQILKTEPECFKAVTIGGAEHLYPASLFKEFYSLAKDAGLSRSVHAGEAMGAESIWSAIKDLDVQRIGHGIRACEDPDLVKYLTEQELPLEVCISSNLQTGVVSDLLEHPVRALFENNVPITINTDDPTFFSTSLATEFELLRALHFTEQEISLLRLNASRYSFLELE